MRGILVVLVVSFVAGVATPSPATVEYNPPIDLGSFGVGEDQAWANSINNAGAIVGQAYAPQGQLPFLWRAGDGMQTFGDLIWPFGVHAINDSGQIVGWDLEGAFLYEDGIVRRLGTVRANEERAYDINNLGQVVGGARLGDPQRHPAIFEVGAAYEIEALYGSYGEARGVNDLGQIVGYYRISIGVRAFLYEDHEGVTDLGTLGTSYSYAYDINNFGQIVGCTSDHAFLYHEGTMQDLGGRAAYAINDAGQIVGHSGGRAALWTTEGDMTDIHPEGWQSSYAMDINNRGWIVGHGAVPDGRNRAFLLTPADEILITVKVKPQGLRLLYQVPQDSTYQLGVSNDLSIWQAQSEVVSPMHCILLFVDTEALGLRRRFYRLEVLSKWGPEFNNSSGTAHRLLREKAHSWQ